MAGYDDGRVACTDQEIVIRHYYPLGSKRIKYQDIREVRVTPLGGMGRWRIQGSGDLVSPWSCTWTERSGRSSPLSIPSKSPPSSRPMG